MTKTALAVGIIAVASLGDAARADEQPGAQAGSLAQACQFDVKGDRKDEWKRAPKAESSVTAHRLTAGGKSIDYTATAGTLVIRDDDDKPIADMGYIAYSRRDVKDAAARALMFAFNGGPGSSSLWLHMGVLGPGGWSSPIPIPPRPRPITPWRTSSACSTRAIWS